MVTKEDILELLRRARSCNNSHIFNEKAVYEAADQKSRNTLVDATVGTATDSDNLRAVITMLGYKVTKFQGTNH